MADNQGVDYQREDFANAIAFGSVFPPDRKGFSEAFRPPGMDKVKAFRGKGTVFSWRVILAYAVPTSILLVIFVALHFVLPDSVPIFNDWIWVLGLPPVLAIPFSIYLSSMRGMDDLAAHIGKYGFQTKWLIRAALPEKLFGKTMTNRVQLINVVSCHPSPNGGRSGDSYEVVPAIVTMGLRPLDKFPSEDNPVNNDIIVDPAACADESHPPVVIHQTGDEGDPVAEYVLRSVEDVRDDRYYEDLAYMKLHGIHEAAVTSIDDDDLIIKNPDYREEMA